MTSEEFRTNPLLLRNQFERTGTFEIPLIRKNEVTLENLLLIGYDKNQFREKGSSCTFLFG